MSDRIEKDAIGNAIIITSKIADGAITADKIAPNSIGAAALSPTIAAQSAGIKITSIVYLSGANVAGTGGEFVNLTGSGFYNGATVFIQNNQCLTYYVNSTTLQFRVPTTLSTGIYWVYVKNTDGAVAFRPNAISVSLSPTWSSPAAGLLGTYLTQNLISISFVATSDSTVSYNLESGSVPSGWSLSSSGVLSGTTPASSVVSSPFYFTVKATDQESQTATRSFILQLYGSVGITSVVYPNNQTAISTSFAETVTIRGTNFLSGAIATIQNQSLGITIPLSTTVSNSTTLSFTTPGTYVPTATYGLKIQNTDGTFGNIFANVIRFSNVPSWTGSSILQNIELDIPYSANIFSIASVSSDSQIRYFTASNINLPTGMTINANTGVLSGITAINSAVIYGFTINAFDSENQSTPLRFTTNIQLPPTLTTSLTLTSSIDGGQTSVYGNNFSTSATVWFEGIPTTTTYVSSNQLNYISPPRAFGSYNVYVTQGSGNLQISNTVSVTTNEQTWGRQLIQRLEHIHGLYHLVLALFL